MDSTIEHNLAAIRARMHNGSLTREELLEIMKELNALISEVTTTLHALTSHLELLKRSEEQIRMYK
jgi:hypothetical protein